ncbi:MAG: PaaI family thioesterase, partial [Pseudomonadota bacterium]
MSRAEQLQDFLESIPFAQTLGIRCDIHGDEMTSVLPFQERLIGNAAIKALHGGAIGSFLELTAMAQVFLLTDLEYSPGRTDLRLCLTSDSRLSDQWVWAD